MGFKYLENRIFFAKFSSNKTALKLMETLKNALEYELSPLPVSQV